MNKVVIFIYDGTFEGLLSCVFSSYQEKINPDIILKDTEQKPLFYDHEHHITTDDERSKRVWNSLEKKLSSFAIRMLLGVFLSEVPGIEMRMFRYMCKNINSLISVEMNFGDEDVITLSKLAKKVGSEARKIIQFVRFQQTKDGVYFAPVSPVYNVLSITTGHFRRRYADQEWIIYDTKRNYGFYYNLSEIAEVTFSKDVMQSFSEGSLSTDKASEDELFFRELWKTHFQHLTIKERFNPKLQRQMMPLKYWKYLIEMQ